MTTSVITINLTEQEQRFRFGWGQIQWIRR